MLSVSCLWTCSLRWLVNSFSLQSDGFLKDNNNAAQRLLDGVNYISQSVSELSVKPAKAVTSWLTDQIAPAYWKPNSLILVNDETIRSVLTRHTDTQIIPVNSKVNKGGEETQHRDNSPGSSVVYMSCFSTWQHGD